MCGLTYNSRFTFCYFDTVKINLDNLKIDGAVGTSRWFNPRAEQIFVWPKIVLPGLGICTCDILSMF